MEARNLKKGAGGGVVSGRKHGPLKPSPFLAITLPQSANPCPFVYRVKPNGVNTLIRILLVSFKLFLISSVYVYARHTRLPDWILEDHLIAKTVIFLSWSKVDLTFRGRDPRSSC